MHSWICARRAGYTLGFAPLSSYFSYSRWWQSRRYCFHNLLYFSDDSAKTDTARITKLDKQMFNDESGKPFILGSKDQRPRSGGTKTLSAWLFALLWVLASFI